MPFGFGVGDGPVFSTTWLLVTSTGMSRIDVSLPRRSSGQRTVMSKDFSPSVIVERALPPSAVWMTLLTSAALTPHFLHFSRSTRKSRLVAPLMLNTPTSVMPRTPLSGLFQPSAVRWSDFLS